MQFQSTQFDTAYLAVLDVFSDSRGFFAEAWNAQDFAHRGVEMQALQANISFNHKAGTLRGMHFQHTPHTEIKLVRCIRGSIYDVIVDIRRDSPTYLKWQGFELSDDNRHMLIVPKGFAHGYQTLTDGAEVMYLVSEYYNPSAADGMRWDDPAAGIVWPQEVTAIADRDANYPDWKSREKHPSF